MSEIQNQPAGLLIDVLFLSHATPQQLHPLTISFLRNACFQKNLCAVCELVMGLVLVISCEPVKVETETRNFSALEAQRVYKLSMSGGNETGIPVPIFCPTSIGTSPF